MKNEKLMLQRGSRGLKEIVTRPQRQRIRERFVKYYPAQPVKNKLKELIKKILKFKLHTYDY
jgi:hypothetical protein